METAIEDMTNKKTTEDDVVPVDVLKVVGEDGLRILLQLLKNIYDTGDCPKDYTQFTRIILNKKPKATEFTENCTISLITYTAKILGKILRRRFEKVIENIFEEDQFRIGSETGARDAIFMLRILS